MATKAVTIQGLKFWICEFVNEGKGWKSVHRFLQKERREGRIENKDIGKAKRSYFYHLKRHPSHFPESGGKVAQSRG